MAAKVLVLSHDELVRLIAAEARRQGVVGRGEVYVTCDSVCGDKAEVRALVVWDDEGGSVPYHLTDQQREDYNA